MRMMKKQQKSTMGSKGRLLIITSTLLTVVFCIILIKIKTESPYEFLQRKQTDEDLRPVEFLGEGRTESGITMVCYVNKAGKLACVLLEERFYGLWRIGTSAFLYPGGGVPYLYSAFMTTDPKTDIIWGILEDSSIEHVFLDGVSCNIMQTDYSFSIFWLVGSLNPNAEIVFR